MTLPKRTKKEIENAGTRKKTKLPKRIVAYTPYFSIKIPYVVTGFEELNMLGEYEKDENGIYTWTFPLNHFEDVQAVLTKKIEFEPQAVHTILQHCPELEMTLKTETDNKGKGYCVVHALTPEEFIVEYTEGGKIKEQHVSRATVKALWDNGIKDLNYFEPTPSRKVWNKIIMGNPIKRFIRANGLPDGDKFFGARGDYHRYFYDPIKVLQALDLVEHTRSGNVIKKGDWEDTGIDQAEFVETSIVLWQNKATIPMMEKRSDITNWVEKPEDIPKSIKGNF